MIYWLKHSALIRKMPWVAFGFAFILCACTKQDDWKRITTESGLVIKLPPNYTIETKEIPLPDVSAYIIKNESSDEVFGISIMTLPEVDAYQKSKIMALEKSFKLGEHIKNCGIISSRVNKNSNLTNDLSVLGWQVIGASGSKYRYIQYFYIGATKVNSNELKIIRRISSQITC